MNGPPSSRSSTCQGKDDTRSEKCRRVFQIPLHTRTTSALCRAVPYSAGPNAAVAYQDQNFPVQLLNRDKNGVYDRG